MVDVDRPAGESGAEVVAQDLHVAGEDHEVDAVGVDEIEHRRFLAGLAVGLDREVDEGDPVALGDLAAVGVVGHDEGDVDGEPARAPAVQQIDQAVVVTARP